MIAKSLVENIRLYHHPCTAAEWSVVNGFVYVFCVIPELDGLKRPDAFFQCLA